MQQFMVLGLHIGQDLQLDLPILSIYGETTDDIVVQVDMVIQVLGASTPCWSYFNVSNKWFLATWPAHLGTHSSM